MNKYGFPYKGSKNKLAERIVKLFPDAENFYDLFCGGCAITHRALIENRWKNYVINDIDSRCPKLFLDAINGKFKNETRWISREDFFRLKDNDGYIAFCWSFGNNGRSYMYGPSVIPYKQALHSALFHNDLKKINQLFNTDFSSLKNEDNVYKKYIFIKKIFPKPYQLESLNRLLRLQNLERLQRLQRLQNSNINNIQTFSKSYDEIIIMPNSIIYCDIPYSNTEKYRNIPFDLIQFYSWCKNQKELVFISSYEMPGDFIPIASFNHSCTYNSVVNNKVIEKVFIPKHQIDLYKSKINACV